MMGRARTPGISVVVPVFSGSSTLDELVVRLHGSLQTLGPYEIILVDDGSPDHSWQVISRLSTAFAEVIGIRMGRNYGQHAALLAGVRAARYSLVVTLDDDLQNPPEEIPRLISYLDEKDLDVVYGVPERVEQNLSRRLAGRLTRRVLQSSLNDPDMRNFSSFRVFRTRLREAYSGELGVGVSLDALLTWGSSSFGSLPVRHAARRSGSSNYTLLRLLRFAADTATGYTAWPLQAASVLGFVTAAIGACVLVFVVGRRLLTGESVPGFPFLAATIAIFSGAQLLTLGVMGEYLARMHFRLMRKPTFVIAEWTDNAPEAPTGR
jgi:undecaprenyl-phosphate 4-deoxy-4-formamido-L-arabinose transferase